MTTRKHRMEVTSEERAQLLESRAKRARVEGWNDAVQAAELVIANFPYTIGSIMPSAEAKEALVRSLTAEVRALRKED